MKRNLNDTVRAIVQNLFLIIALPEIVKKGQGTKWHEESFYC